MGHLVGELYLEKYDLHFTFMAVFETFWFGTLTTYLEWLKIIFLMRCVKMCQQR